MDLASPELKNVINQTMRNVFDTFKRVELVRFYLPAAETAIVESPSYIARLQQYTNFDNVTYVPQYHDLEARIIYPKRENTTKGFIQNDDLQAKMQQELGIVRIQIKPEDLEYLVDVERFVLYEEEYQRIATPRRLGVLGTINVISFDLKRVGNHFGTNWNARNLTAPVIAYDPVLNIVIYSSGIWTAKTEVKFTWWVNGIDTGISSPIFDDFDDNDEIWVVETAQPGNVTAESNRVIIPETMLWNNSEEVQYSNDVTVGW